MIPKEEPTWRLQLREPHICATLNCHVLKQIKISMLVSLALAVVIQMITIFTQCSVVSTKRKVATQLQWEMWAHGSSMVNGRTTPTRSFLISTLAVLTLAPLPTVRIMSTIIMFKTRPRLQLVATALPQITNLSVWQNALKYTENYARARWWSSKSAQAKRLPMCVNARAGTLLD